MRLKRIISLLLGMALILSLNGCTRKVEQEQPEEVPPTETTEESETPPPEEETSDTQTDDLSNSIGYYYTMPSKTNSSPLGIDTLFFYTERPETTPGKGKLTLHNAADDSVVMEIDCSDPNKVKKAEASDYDKSWTGWTNPSVIVINLDQPLTGGDYYVTAEEGCFIIPNTDIRNLAFDKNYWTFRIEPYGVLKEEYSSGDPLTGKVNGTATQTITVAEPAVKAVVTEFDGEMVGVSQEEFTKDGTLTVTYKKAGTAFWVIGFYDKDDNPITGLSYQVTVTE